MNITQIEDSLKTIIKSLNKESFIYEFLLAYGLPKASITRLQKGNLNLSKVDGEVSWKKKLFFLNTFTVKQITLAPEKGQSGPGGLLCRRARGCVCSRPLVKRSYVMSFCLFIFVICYVSFVFFVSKCAFSFVLCIVCCLFF